MLPGWKTRNGQRKIRWAEAIGFELLIRQICAERDLERAYRVYGDNQGVVEGWGNGRSRNREVNEVFKRLHALIESAAENISFFPEYVRSADNPADGPLRGIFPPKHLMLPQIPIPDKLSELIIKVTEPFTPAEQYERKHTAAPNREYT